MKKFKLEYLFYFLLVVIFLLPFFNLINLEIIKDLDYSTFISIVMLIILLIDPEKRVFKSVFLKSIVLLSILIQMLFVILIVYIPAFFNKSFYNYYTNIIILILFMIIIINYFNINFSQEFYFLKRDVKKVLRKDQPEGISDAIKKVGSWIRNNRGQKQRRDEAFKLIEECVDRSLSKSTSIIKTSSIKEVDDFIDDLFVFYKYGNNSLKYIEKFIDLIFRIIDVQDKIGNKQISEKYIDLLSSTIFVKEISENDEESIILYIEALENKLIQLENIDSLKRFIENLKIEYLKYEFKFSDLTYIHLFQFLIKIIIEKESCFSEKEIKNHYSFIIDRVLYKGDTNNLIIFRDSSLNKILNNQSNTNQFIDLLNIIINKSESKTKVESQLSYLLNKKIDEKIELMKCEDKHIGLLYLFKLKQISRLGLNYFGLINFDELYDYLVYIEKYNIYNEENDENFRLINSIFKEIINNNQLQNYFLDQLEEITTEKNYQKTIKVFNMMKERIYDKNSIVDHTHFLSLIESFIINYRKEKINERISTEDKLVIIKDILLDIKQSFSDEFITKLFNLIGKYLNDVVIGNEMFDFLYEESLTEIESSNKDVVHTSSNIFGWYIFKFVKNAYKNSVELTSLTRNTNKIFDFYKFVFKHLDTNTTLFVGTLFVVNGIYLDYLDIKTGKPNIKLIRDYFFKKISDLHPDLKKELIKSFEIRKHSIYKYIENIDEKALAEIIDKFKTNHNLQS